MRFQPLLAAVLLFGLSFTPATADVPPQGELSGEAGSRLLRLAPIGAEILLPEGTAGRTIGSTAWEWVDGDLTTSLRGADSELSVLGIFLAQPKTLAALRVHGPAQGSLTLLTERDGRLIPLPGLDGIDLRHLPHGWSTFPAAGGAAAQTLVAEWHADRAGALLPEIELWGSRPQLEPGSSSESFASGARVLSPLADDAGGPAETFRFLVEEPVTSYARAFLSYRLDSTTHWVALPRSINGLALRGGAAGFEVEKDRPAVEEIQPRWLRRGVNEVRFGAPASALRAGAGHPLTEARAADGIGSGGPAPSGLRLILVPRDGRTLAGIAEAGNPALRRLADGDEGTGLDLLPGQMESESASPSFRLESRSQPLAVELAVAPGATGEIRLEALLEGGGWTDLLEPLDLGALSPGWHRRLVGDGFPAIVGLRVVPADPGQPVFGLREIELLGSPAATTTQAPRLVLSFPKHGEAAPGGAYLRGFIDLAVHPRQAVELYLDGEHVAEAVDPRDGSFEMLAPRPAEVQDGEAWSVQLLAVFPNGRRLVRTLWLGGEPPSADTAFAGEWEADSGPRLERLARPGEPQRLDYRGARLEVARGAVAAEVRLSVEGVSGARMPALEAGMTNVTAVEECFRFGPHGMQFAAPVRLTLPYDPAKIPDGMGPQDVRTYYFDEGAGRWIPVHRESVEAGRAEIVSLTDHFTDFINATLSVPDGPQGQSFGETSIRQLEAADPAAGIDLIAPPAANPRGDADLSFPLRLPPGRRGLAPQLEVSYSSRLSNGWLGLGWDLAVSSVEVSTLFGVPRYDPSLETESYLVDGSFLAPTAAGTALAPRVADRSFTRRVEGDFQRIVRKGDDPSNYWWEITDQDGTRFLYGQTPQARLSDHRSGATFRWHLEAVVDVYGNRIDYSYFTDRGAGPGEPWVQTYLQRIDYTAGSGGAYYRVLFHLDDASDPALLRPDRFSTGMPGFKVLTRRTLRSVDVLAGGERVRSYRFLYRQPEKAHFYKTLLAAIAVDGEDGEEFYRHTFDYFSMEEEGEGFDGFSPQETWGQMASGDDATGSRNISGGGHAFAGIGPPSCALHAGAQVGGSFGDNTTLVSLLDVNGDGLPDRIDEAGNVDLNRYDHAADQGGFSAASFAGTTSLGHDTEYSFDIGLGAHALGDLAVLGASTVWSHTNQDGGIADVNGDGLPDLVTTSGGFSVRYNDGRSFGASQPWAGYRIDDLDLGIPEQDEQVMEEFKLSDTLLQLVLPFSGTVQITGAAQKLQAVGEDGVRASIYRNGSRVWRHTFAAGDTSPCEPAGGNTCGDGLSLTVGAGDRLYFRTHSIAETSGDDLRWAPRVTYVDRSASQRRGREPYGAKVFVFDAAEDFRLAGLPKGQWKASAEGDVRIFGPLEKSPTSDDVVVRVKKNGTEIYSRTLAADATGVFDEIPAISVQVDDEVVLILKSDQPIDAERVRWTPTVSYEGGLYCVAQADGGQTCGTVSCAPDPVSGEEVCQVDGVADFELPLGVVEQALQPWYSIPRLEPAAQPTVSWRAPAAGSYTFDVGYRPAPFATAPVQLYVQKVHTLLDKRQVQPSATGAFYSITETLAEGEEIFFTALAASERDLGLFGVSQGGNAVPANRRYRHPDPLSVLSGGYHRWHYGEWDGNQSFTESGLDEESEDFVALAPSWQGSGERSDPLWLGAGFDFYLGAGQVKPSRRGMNATVELRRASGGAGVSGGGPGILRKTYGFSLGGTLGAGVGLALSSGYSTSQIDLMDFNGDRYPDQISAGGVRFSDGHGGFGGLQSLAPLGEGVREFDDGNFSKSVGGVGLGSAFSKKDAKGKTQSVAMTMPTVASTTSLSQTQFDLVDVNGDGLPDRVRMDPGSGAMEVRLNLGYRFGLPESWEVPRWSSATASRCREPVDFLDDAVFDLIGDLDNVDTLGLTSSASLNVGVAVGPIGGGVGTTLSRTLVQLMDVNGDGLKDHVYKDDGEAFFRVKLNRGDGWGAEEPWHVETWSAGQLGGRYNLAGNFQCLDAIQYSGNIAGNGSVGVPICIPLIPPAPVAGLQLEVSVQASGGDGGLQLFFDDLDGDGLPDHALKKGGDANVYVKRNNAGRVNLLREVRRPLGGSFRLDYRRQGNVVDRSDPDQIVDMPSNQWVLSSVSTEDGLDSTAPYVTRFEYFNSGYYDRLERVDYGYSRVREIRPDGSSLERIFHNQDFYLRHNLIRSELRDADGRLFTVEERTYAKQPVADGSVFPALTRQRTSFHEGTGGAPKDHLRTLAYDSLGRIVRIEDFADAGSDDDTVTTIRYQVDPGAYIVRPVQIEARGSAGQLLRRRQGTYDGRGSLVRLEKTLQGGRDPATGAAYSASDAAVWTMTYDSVGNLSSITDPVGFQTSYTYDPTVQTYPTSTVDGFGYRSTAIYDLKYGLPLGVTDYSGNRMERRYDEFGRLSELFGPYDIGATPTVAISYFHDLWPARALTRNKDVTRGDPIDTVVFIDGLERNLQTKVDSELDLGQGSATRIGMRVSGSVAFDALGRVAAEGQPTFDTGPATDLVDAPLLHPTHFTYDTLDRVVRVDFPFAASTRVDYDIAALDGVARLRTTHTDPEGRVTRQYRDVRGLLLTLEQRNRIRGVDTQLLTRYAYNPAAELISVTDPAGNATRAEFDTLGRRIVIDSPDAGRTESRYDRAGNLGAKITANLRAQGQQIRYLRNFNRLERIDYPELTDVTFTYGAPGAPFNGAARVVRIQDQSGVEEIRHGRLGEVVLSIETPVALNGFSPRGPYTTAFEYDSFNRLLGITYPDGEELSYVYDAGGRLQAASGELRGVTYPYLDHQGYDEFGQLVRRRFGNGVETRLSYETRSRRLSRLHSAGPRAPEFQDLQPSYDKSGMILRLDNDVPVPRSPDYGGPVTQTFAYDGLTQLVAAGGSYRYPPNKRSDYSVTLSYDEIGNLRTKNQAHDLIQPNGRALRQRKTSFDWTFDYGGPQPHAATHVGEQTFHFDLNGNQTGWEHDRNGTRRTIEWDEENRVRSLADNGRTTRFLYNSVGTRTHKQGQHGETIYVNPYFSIRNGSIASKHFYDGSTRLVTKMGRPAFSTSKARGNLPKPPKPQPGPTEDQRYYYHGDHLGSSHFVSDADGELYQHLEYFPSGEVWVDERSESQRTPYLFSAKELDEETGLYYFEARYYEPRLGQFTSPDPLLGSLLDTAAVSRPSLSATPFLTPGDLYSYAGNNPVNLNDPSGLTKGLQKALDDSARRLEQVTGKRKRKVRAASVPQRVAQTEVGPPKKRSRQNRNKGKRFETVSEDIARDLQLDQVTTQVTVRPNGPGGAPLVFPGTGAPVRIRPDIGGVATASTPNVAAGTPVFIEAKATRRAPFTPGQTIGLPALRANGGTVVRGPDTGPLATGAVLPPSGVFVTRRMPDGSISTTGP